MTAAAKLPRKAVLALLGVALVLPYFAPGHVEAAPITLKPVSGVIIDQIVPLDPSIVGRQGLSKLDAAILDKFAARNQLELAKPVRALGGGSFGANTYMPGQCTWYAKQRRPDLPSNLGNANTWNDIARADGWNVGSKPYPDSIGVSELPPYGHVFYVRQVNPDGSFEIDEMNWLGPFAASQRHIASPAGYEFIY